MRFLVDAQLPAALARWLVAAGHEAEHVGDVGLASASDADVWSYALRRGVIIISKDEDFAKRNIVENSGPTIVWIRLGNSRRNELLAWFERALPTILDAIDRGDTLIEVI